MLCRGVVVSQKLKDQVLLELHADHQGIIKNKGQGTYIYVAASIAMDMEMFIKKSYILNQHNPKLFSLLHPWEYPILA